MILTNRESEICKYVIEGKTNKQIGKILHISHYTVKSHLKKIFLDSEFLNRTQLAYYIGKNNII